MDETLRRRRQEWAEARRRKERRGGRIILAVLAVLTAGTAYSAVQRLRAAGTDVASLGIADYRAEATGERRPAPEFVYPGLRQGETISSSAFEGEVLVVNFWASWCGPCKAEAPRLVASAQRYAGKVVFLGVDVQDFESDARRFLERYDTNYVSVRDGGSSTYENYGLTGIPETYYLDARGHVVAHAVGEISPEELEAGIADAVAGS